MAAHWGDGFVVDRRSLGGGLAAKSRSGSRMGIKPGAGFAVTIATALRSARRNARRPNMLSGAVERSSSLSPLSLSLSRARSTKTDGKRWIQASSVVCGESQPRSDDRRCYKLVSALRDGCLQQEKAVPRRAEAPAEGWNRPRRSIESGMQPRQGHTGAQAGEGTRLLPIGLEVADPELRSPSERLSSRLGKRHRRVRSSLRGSTGG